MMRFLSLRCGARTVRIALTAGGLGVLAATAAGCGWATAQDRPARGPGDVTRSGDITRQVQSETPIALPSLAPLVKRVMPAVVNVSVHERAEAASPTVDDFPGGALPGQGGTPFDQFLRRFFGEPGGTPPGVGPRGGAEVMALGSGFIVDPAGYVVTNNHVVGNADSVTVIFQDNTRHPARIVGRDPQTDIVLVKIKTDRPLPYVTWGDSRTAEVGDWVVAVGNPFGLGGTVTAGIISALGRDINEGEYDDFIQIDAPMNRGNSGGPTFDLKGQVIGINTAIYSPSGGSVGIGFAIPSSLARDIVAQLREHGHVTRGWLGVEIQDVTPEIARGLGLDPNAPHGALVAAVTPKSPAAAAGLRSGDVITEVNGHPIRTVHDLPPLVAKMPVGSTLRMTVSRNGRDQHLAATVARMPENPRMAAAEPPGDRRTARPTQTTALGMELVPLTPRLRRSLQVPAHIKGVVVAAIAPDSPALPVGLQPGDVIQSIDQRPADSPAAAAKALREAGAKGLVLLLLNRHGTSQFVGVPVAPRRRAPG